MAEFSDYTYNKNTNYIKELERYFTDYENSFDTESCLFAIKSIHQQVSDLKEMYYSIPDRFIQENDPNRIVLEALNQLSSSKNEESDISSSESSRENTPTEYNPKKSRRNFPYKIIIDTHGCVYRNEKK